MANRRLEYAEQRLRQTCQEVKQSRDGKAKVDALSSELLLASCREPYTPGESDPCKEMKAMIERVREELGI